MTPEQKYIRSIDRIIRSMMRHLPTGFTRTEAIIHLMQAADLMAALERAESPAD